MKIRWELIEGEEKVRGKQVSSAHSCDVTQVKRAKVPGGWFVFVQEGVQLGTAGAFFYSDPTHEWDGASIDWRSPNRLRMSRKGGRRSLPEEAEWTERWETDEVNLIQPVTYIVLGVLSLIALGTGLLALLASGRSILGRVGAVLLFLLALVCLIYGCYQIYLGERWEAGYFFALSIASFLAGWAFWFLGADEGNSLEWGGVMADANGIDRTDPPDRDAALRSLCDQLEEIRRQLERVQLQMDLIEDTLGYRPNAWTKSISGYSSILAELVKRVETILGDIAKAREMEAWGCFLKGAS
jgi:hypothetical protein